MFPRHNWISTLLNEWRDLNRNLKKKPKNQNQNNQTTKHHQQVALLQLLNSSLLRNASFLMLQPFRRDSYFLRKSMRVTSVVSSWSCKLDQEMQLKLKSSIQFLFPESIFEYQVTYVGGGISRLALIKSQLLLELPKAFLTLCS